MMKRSVGRDIELVFRREVDGNKRDQEQWKNHLASRLYFWKQYILRLGSKLLRGISLRPIGGG